VQLLIEALPIGPEIPLEEGLQVLKECESNTILTGPQQTPLCEELKNRAECENYPMQVIPLTILKTAPADISGLNLHIDEKQAVSAGRPSLVIRTTGTTGGPKSVVQTRRLFYRSSQARSDDLILIHENLDITSAAVSIMMRVLSGCKGEVLPTNPGPAAIWERLKKGGMTSLTDHSWFWEHLARHFQEHISSLPFSERSQYVQGVQSLRWACIVGTPPPPWLLAFWRETFGHTLQVGYVATELGVVALSTSASIEVRD
jgi:malonyl-CoA/methylmalonyl-CoA synthetase